VSEDSSPDGLRCEFYYDGGGAVRAGLARPVDLVDGRRELRDRLQVTVGFGAVEAWLENAVIELSLESFASVRTSVIG
jgi:hypothetical protein